MSDNEELDANSEDSNKIADGLKETSKIDVNAESKDGDGKTDGQYHANASAGVTETASIGVKSHADIDGASVDGKASLDESSGAQAHASGSIGSDGVKASAGGSVGSSVGVNLQDTVSDGKNSVSAGVDPSVGDQLSAHVSGQLTEKDHVVTLEVGGKLAAVIGIKGHVDVKINTKPIGDDVDSAEHTASEIWDKLT